jgi:hypothetical protein
VAPVLVGWHPPSPSDSTELAECPSSVVRLTPISVNLSDRSCTALGAVGRKTRRAEDMVKCSKVFAPVLSRAVGVPLPPEHPSLPR